MGQLWRILALAAMSTVSLVAQKKVDYHKDVRFAVDAIGKECKVLLKAKGIDWRKVTKPLVKASKKIKKPEDHLLLLWRLLARLEDGHARVDPLPAGKGIRVDWPVRDHGPGLFLCRIGDDVYVKNAWGPAEAANLRPGMRVAKIAGKAAGEWLDSRTAELRDLISFSTDHQADFYARHWGLADVRGTRLQFEVLDGKAKKKRKIAFRKLNQTPSGPAFRPADTQRHQNLYFAETADGFGYVHVRRCKGSLPSEMDHVLAELGEINGIILDFRGNSGGGFDHRALFGRFLPKGKSWRVGSGYQSQGERPFGGPMVVIVDATCRSAGETAAGQFTEDGRAYGIGESPTAGMSASKKTIELPSGLFALYVSVRSNKSRFAGGKGIEGLGVVPHEIVEFAPADLAAGKDTLIERAAALLRTYPDGAEWRKVRYRPVDHGWQRD
ncbi:MAG: S41 family peptidase [bacterium]|nr:S41 family peptidase [bacterium]